MQVQQGQADLKGWKNSSSQEKFVLGILCCFLIFTFSVTAIHMENQKKEAREQEGCHLLAEVWRRFLSAPDTAWLLEFCKTEEMGVNSSQLVNTEPLQN